MSADYKATVDSKMTAIADEIRELLGTTDTMGLDAMATNISSANSEILSQSELIELITSSLDGKAAAGGSSGGEEWIGDGNTHIWITLPEGRTSPMLGVCPNGTVTVDWGDGSAPDTLTGTSTSTVKWTPNHNYAKPGDYVVTLIVDGEVGFSGTSSTNAGAYILRYSSNSDGRNYAYRNSVQKVELADSVTSIGSYAFAYCNSLASVSIPDSVTSIGNYAFYVCYSLTSVSIPDSVTSIGENAFQSCYSLASVSIPDSVTSIGKNAFYVCYSLTSVSISDSLTSIGYNTFGNCYSLASVSIPDSVTSIDDTAFSYCYSLTSVSIPDSVTSIGASAFTNCDSLSSVSIPGSVTSIGASAFSGCDSLSSVSIPGSVTSIGANAFIGCFSLAYCDFTSHTSVPALSSTNAFNNIAADFEIRVPAVLADEWKAATNWSTYAKYIVGV